jgi:transcriptional regulator with XRE-family HTH domain
MWGYPKRVEHNSLWPTPELLAGQELRRLRRARGWSQEEVARRMVAIGHEGWHQTTVGRTETARRPLRLNETVDLAGLFGVPVTQLLAPIPVQLDEVNEVIRLTEETLADTREEAEELHTELAAAAAEHTEAEGKYRKVVSDLEYLEAHLAIMRGLRDLLLQQQAEEAGDQQ